MKRNSLKVVSLTSVTVVVMIISQLVIQYCLSSNQREIHHLNELGRQRMYTYLMLSSIQGSQNDSIRFNDLKSTLLFNLHFISINQSYKQDLLTSEDLVVLRTELENMTFNDLSGTHLEHAAEIIIDKFDSAALEQIKLLETNVTLARSLTLFSALLAALGALYRVMKIFVPAVEDIQESEAKSKNAEELTRERLRRVKTVSHDLKSPLQSIFFTLELIRVKFKSKRIGENQAFQELEDEIESLDVEIKQLLGTNNFE